MAHIYDQRVLTTSTTTGTGDITVSATAVPGYIPFASAQDTAGNLIAAGDTFEYSDHAVDANGNATGEFECGIGTWLGSNAFSRAPVRSSNADGLVNFAVGDKRVCITLLPINYLTLGRILAVSNGFAST